MVYWADVGLLVVCLSRLSCLHTQSASHLSRQVQGEQIYMRENSLPYKNIFLQDGNSLGKLEGLLASPDQLQGILDAVNNKRTNKRMNNNKRTSLLFSTNGHLEDEEVDERAPFLGQVKTGGYLKAGGGYIDVHILFLW